MLFLSLPVHDQVTIPLVPARVWLVPVFLVREITRSCRDRGCLVQARAPRIERVRPDRPGLVRQGAASPEAGLPSNSDQAVADAPVVQAVSVVGPEAGDPEVVDPVVVAGADPVAARRELLGAAAKRANRGNLSAQSAKNLR